MKPHEEEWTVYQSGKANHGIYRKNPRRTVATRIATYDEAMLLSAAPNMARVLLAQLDQDGHANGCSWGRDPLNSDLGCFEGCAAIRAALTKAGVPIP